MYLNSCKDHWDLEILLCLPHRSERVKFFKSCQLRKPEIAVYKARRKKMPFRRKKNDLREFLSIALRIPTAHDFRVISTRT